MDISQYLPEFFCPLTSDFTPACDPQSGGILASIAVGLATLLIVAGKGFFESNLRDSRLALVTVATLLLAFGVFRNNLAFAVALVPLLAWVFFRAQLGKWKLRLWSSRYLSLQYATLVSVPLLYIGVAGFGYGWNYFSPPPKPLPAVFLLPPVTALPADADMVREVLKFARSNLSNVTDSKMLVLMPSADVVGSPEGLKKFGVEWGKVRSMLSDNQETRNREIKLVRNNIYSAARSEQSVPIQLSVEIRTYDPASRTLRADENGRSYVEGIRNHYRVLTVVLAYRVVEYLISQNNIHPANTVWQEFSKAFRDAMPPAFEALPDLPDKVDRFLAGKELCEFAYCVKELAEALSASAKLASDQSSAQTTRAQKTARVAAGLSITPEAASGER